VNVLVTSINAISIACLQVLVQYQMIIVVILHRLLQQKHALHLNKHIHKTLETQQNGLLLTYKLMTHLLNYMSC